MSTTTTVPTVDAVVDIAAPPERVFQALTDARELPAWWGSDDTYRTRDWHVDARPGGGWSARTTDAGGREGFIGGVFRVVDAPRTLEHTWVASWDDGPPGLVRYELAPCEVRGRSGTRVRVTHVAGVTAFASVGATAGALARHLDADLALALRPARPAYHRRRAFARRVVA